MAAILSLSLLSWAATAVSSALPSPLEDALPSSVHAAPDNGTKESLLRPEPSVGAPHEDHSMPQPMPGELDQGAEAVPDLLSGEDSGGATADVAEEAAGEVAGKAGEAAGQAGEAAAQAVQAAQAASVAEAKAAEAAEVAVAAVETAGSSGGGRAATLATTTPLPERPMWTVTQGQCRVTGGCIESPHYPHEYSSGESCEITVDSSNDRPIVVSSFDAKGINDRLTVNGASYSGFQVPEGVVPSGKVLWTSDGGAEGAGWKLCLRPPQTNADGHGVGTSGAVPPSKSTATNPPLPMPAGMHAPQDVHREVPARTPPDASEAVPRNDSAPPGTNVLQGAHGARAFPLPTSSHQPPGTLEPPHMVEPPDAHVRQEAFLPPATTTPRDMHLPTGASAISPGPLAVQVPPRVHPLRAPPSVRTAPTAAPALPPMTTQAPSTAGVHVGPGPHSAGPRAYPTDRPNASLPVNVTSGSLQDVIRSQAHSKLDAFALTSFSRARCLKPHELFLLRAHLAVHVLGDEVTSSSAMTLVLPLVARAAADALQPAHDTVAKRRRLSANHGMAALAAKRFVGQASGEDGVQVAASALRLLALSQARSAFGRMPGAPDPQEASSDNDTISTAYQIIRGFPCKRLEQGRVRCSPSAGHQVLGTMTALMAVTAEAATHILPQQGSGAVGAIQLPRCNRTDDDELNAISKRLPPKLHTELAKKFWEEALQHMRESSSAWQHKWCAPGDSACDHARLNFTSLRDEVFGDAALASADLAPPSSAAVAKPMTSQAQSSWEYMQSAASTANALTPGSALEFVSMDPPPVHREKPRQELAKDLKRFSNGGGLAHVEWFVPCGVSIAAAVLLLALCGAYLWASLTEREAVLLPELPQSSSAAAMGHQLLSCERFDGGFDGCGEFQGCSPVPVCGHLPSCEALIKSAGTGDGAAMETHAPAGRKPHFLDNCCCALTTLTIAGHFLTAGFAPNIHGYLCGNWLMQAFHNYVESFAAMMLAVSVGFLSQSAGHEGTKRLAAHVAMALLVLTLVELAMGHAQELHGNEWFRLNPHAAWATSSFLQGWFLWLVLTPILRSMRPPVVLFAAYAVSWASGYWVQVPLEGQALHVETCLAHLGFYSTGLLLPVEYLAYLDQHWAKVAGTFVTAAVLVTHLWLAFISEDHGPGDGWLVAAAAGPAHAPEANDYGLHFHSWQVAAARQSYFIDASAASAQLPVLFWIAWTQRLAHQFLICWPSGLALLAILPHGKSLLTEWGSRFIYPFVGHVISLCLTWGWLKARFGEHQPIHGLVAWAAFVFLGAVSVNAFWACQATHGWAQHVLEPKWIYSILRRDREEDSADHKGRARGGKSFSHYVEKALHFTVPPASPTWIYTSSKGFGQGTGLWSLVWFTCLVPLVLLFWKLAAHKIIFVNLRTIVSVHLMHILSQCVINYCAPWPEKDSHHVNNPSYLERIGCIVPCHKSAGEIKATLQSLLQFLKPEHIVVVDNGNSVEPLDETQRVVEELNPAITYLWVPIGMKTNALWVGLNKLPPTVEYVMHIDDDTECPPDMVFDEHVWDHSHTDAVSYGIVMYQTGIVEKLVDLEFKAISQFRLFQSRFSTVWFQHGIIGIWRRKAFTEVLQEHPFLPFGEDNWNGTINLLRNREMRQELRSHVITYAPPTLLPGGTFDRQQGYGAANIWKQRAERWNVNAPRRFWIRFYLLLFHCHETLLGNIVFRVLSLLHLIEIYAHLTTPLVVLIYAFSESFSWSFVWQGLLLHYVFYLGEFTLQNYYWWRHRKDIQVDLLVVLLMPFYKFFLMLCTWYGHWRCLLWYIPFFPMRCGLYTEGGMNPVLLKHLHNIDTSADDGEEIGSRCLLNLEDGSTGAIGGPGTRDLRSPLQGALPLNDMADLLLSADAPKSGSRPL